LKILFFEYFPLYPKKIRNNLFITLY